MMLADVLLPDTTQCQLQTVTATDSAMTLTMITCQPVAPCPTCGVNSDRVHSRYWRTLRDLPWAQLPVIIQLQVRRFFCRTATCPRRTFAEPVPAMTRPFARRTVRLSQTQQQLGLDLGGAVGARIATRHGMAVSAATILRLVRRTPQPQPNPAPRKIGVDDFALRKGQVYGTIVIDLETHAPLDVLPDRSAATLERWLKHHPGIEVIARDRATDYAEAARNGAPDAVQVADRFHLLQNVREMLQRVLERHTTALRTATAAIQDAPPVVPDQPAAGVVHHPTDPSSPHDQPPDPNPAAYDSVGAARRAERLDTYQRVRTLAAQGLSVRAIAEQVQVSRQTVRRYGRADTFPERATRQRLPSKLDPFMPYLRQQLRAGQTNGMQLWRELRDQHGYTGSRALVARWIARHRHLVPASEPAPTRQRGRPPRPASEVPPRPPRRYSARQAAWFLVKQPAERSKTEQRLVDQLCRQHADIATAHDLGQAFTAMVRERQADRLDRWLQQMETSAIPELRRFAAGITRDKAAVHAALSLAYSNGQTEGQINRLKLIKRSMYGRANFDLLRQRVLARTA